MDEQKGMLKSMIIYIIVITLLLNLGGKFVPLIKEFFAGQEWLTSIVSSYPLLIIIIFAAILSFYTNLYYKFWADKDVIEKMKNIKKENKEMQQKIKEQKDNPQKMMELQKEMASKSLSSFPIMMSTLFSMKFMFLVTIPSLLMLFMVIGPLFNASSVGYIINWGFSIFGRTGTGWLLTLILLSMILTPISKKILKLDF